METNDYQLEQLMLGILEMANDLYWISSYHLIVYKQMFAQSAEGVRPPPHECLGYDTKHSDGEVPTMLELWGM